jgi:hypothetical protein
VTSVQLSRINLLAILVGFVVIVVIGIITSTTSFFISSQIASAYSVGELKSAFIQQQYLTFSWLLRIISFLSPIIGGFVVGRIKNNGWLYGGLLGVVLTVISIGIVSLIFILPTSLIYDNHFPAGYGQLLALKNITSQLLHSPLTIILTAIGGYLGERLHKRKGNKK